MRIPEPLFPNDDGLADPSLLSALASQDRYEIVAALSKSRVFVALLAELEGETTSEMSLAWLVDGGIKALPVFSSIEAITTWNSNARPLGVDVQRAAIVALSQGGIAVLDPGSAHPREIGASALRALALGYEYLPPSIDPEVTSAISQALIDCLGPGIDFTISGEAILEITLSCSGSIPSQEALSNFAAHLAGGDRIRLRLEAEVQIKIARP